MTIRTLSKRTLLGIASSFALATLLLVSGFADARAAVWVDGCREKIWSFLQGGLSYRPDIDLNAKVPGDYLFRDQAGFEMDGGRWGILRVQP